MSGDPEQEYFSDGLTEDIITELSRFDSLLVIARNSTFRFKGQAVDVSKVAGELGVRYVLEGGVRRSGDKLRITAQLIDAETGGHLWAERYDRELTDVFAIQDDVTYQIVTALGSELGDATTTRGDRQLTTSAKAYELFLRARMEKERRLADANATAQDLFNEAIALDATFSAAYAELSHTLQLAWYYGWTEDETALDLALSAAQRAVSLDRSLPVAHLQLGFAHSRFGRFDSAIAAVEEAITLDHNYADGYAVLSYLHARRGSWEEAIAAGDLAVRNDPFSPLAHSVRGLGHFVRGDYDAAIKDFKICIAINPNFGIAHQYLTATYAIAGRNEEAQAQAAEVLRISPNFGHGLSRTPYEDRTVLMRLIEGLRLAGLDVPDPALAE